MLKAVWERKGTSQNLKLNCIGKQIFWLQFLGQFHISLQYVRSEDNVSDSFTRQSPGLEATLSNQVFKTLWEKWGPFEWDLMASGANVMKNPQGQKLMFYSRYFDQAAKGTDLFAQNMNWVTTAYCFPPFPMIGMVLNFLKHQKKDCVMIIPASNEPWVNLLSAHMTDLFEISNPFQTNQFTILNQSGKRKTKKYPHSMLAVKLHFETTPSTLTYLHL